LARNEVVEPSGFIMILFLVDFLEIGGRYWA
jgi:hypothetical protein